MHQFAYIRTNQYNTMAFKYLILASVLAYASAGFLPAAPAVAYSSAPAVSSSYFNQASAPVAHAAYAAPVAHATYAAPVAHATYAAPVAHATYAAPVAHATYAAPIAHATYAAPITHATYAAPAVAHATYGAPAVAVHAPSVGVSQQSVARSLGGAQSVSHYSKAVDSAFSSVRKYDTRFTNDALVAKAVAPVAYAAPVAYGAPVAHAPVVAKAAVAYSPAAVVAHTNFQGLGIEYHY